MKLTSTEVTEWLSEESETSPFLKEQHGLLLPYAKRAIIPPQLPGHADHCEASGSITGILPAAPGG